VALFILSFQPGRLLPFGRVNELLASAIVITLALTISNQVGRWYRRRFGTVRGDSTMHSRRDLLKWTIFYPMVGAALIADAMWQPPILLSGLAWAVAVAAYWASTGRGRNHYLAISGIFALSTLAPLFLGAGSAAQRMNFVLALVGLVYIAAGVLDHLALVRMLRVGGGTDAGAV
jgi:hypothetical protein